MIETWRSMEHWNKVFRLGLNREERETLAGLIVAVSQDERFADAAGALRVWDVPGGCCSLMFAPSLVQRMFGALCAVPGGVKPLLAASKGIDAIKKCVAHGQEYWEDESETLSRQKLGSKKAAYAKEVSRAIAEHFGYASCSDEDGRRYSNPGLILTAAVIAQRRFPPKERSGRCRLLTNHPVETRTPL